MKWAGKPIPITGSRNQRASEIVQQSLVGLDVNLGILRLRQQPRPLLDIEFLPMLETESQKPIVRRLAIEVRNNLLGAPAQGRVAAQQVRAQPFGGCWTEGENLGANRPVNGRVVIPEKVEQGCPLPLGEHFRQIDGASTSHIS